MIKILKHLCKYLTIVAVATTVCAPAFCDANIPLPGIGDYGTWSTTENRELVVNQISTDFEKFHGSVTPDHATGFVPIEAKIGLAFMNAFSHIGHILDSSLVRFTIIFIILMYALWMGLEAYNIITAKADTKSTVQSMLKKSAITAIWIAVLNVGPAETFMMVMSPILSVASLVSDMILNAVTSVAGAQIPDTCTAIHKYAAEHISESNLLTPDAAASIMCIPTRLAGFCYTAVGVGWKWMAYGIGRSMFAFLCGGVTVGGFIYLAWKFAFIAFGVIADLFLGIIMLPFTAIAECVGKTSVEGIVGNIYNGFIKLFSTESLQAQIMRFINAALHFVTMSIVIAVCAALLSGVMTFANSDMLPQFDNPNIWMSMFVMALTWYLASHASAIATEIGGAIDASMGNTLKSDVATLWTGTKKTVKDWYKVIKDASK